jgi:hypothetical protein
VWLSPPSDVDRDRVAVAAGAEGPALDGEDLVAAAAALSPRDEQAHVQLDQTLDRVRGLEDRLDGELVIMRDLDVAIDAIPVLRNERDAERVFAALAYQGFAVARYFAEDLATEDTAAPYRSTIGGRAMVRPWVDAAALAPEREITAYEIAQGPQRAAFRDTQAMLNSEARARIDASAAPEGADLYVDGRTALVAADGSIRVAPGRHWIHATKGGVVAARWIVRVEPGADVALEAPPARAGWKALVDGLGTLRETPPELRDAVRALGGEVWIARPGTKAPEAWRLTTETVAPADVGSRPVVARSKRSAGDENTPLAFSAGGGWFQSDDFYLQDPFEAPRTKDTVNAPLVAAGALWSAGGGALRFGLGGDLLVTLGDHHVALYGDESTHLRPHVFLHAGHEVVGITAGALFPHHGAVGLHGRIPLGPGFALAPRALVGLAPMRDYESGADWRAEPVVAAWIAARWEP